jgi:hypothetical protein
LTAHAGLSSVSTQKYRSIGPRREASRRVANPRQVRTGARSRGPACGDATVQVRIRPGSKPVLAARCGVASTRQAARNLLRPPRANLAVVSALPEAPCHAPMSDDRGAGILGALLRSTHTDSERMPANFRVETLVRDPRERWSFRGKDTSSALHSSESRARPTAQGRSSPQQACAGPQLRHHERFITRRLPSVVSITLPWPIA